MATIECEEFVAAPPTRVFAVFADIPRAADHVEAITGVEMLSSGEVGAGTRWRETRLMHGRSETLELAVERFEPPLRYSVVADAHGTHYESTFEFQPEGDGTRVRMHFAGEARRPLAKVLALLTWPLMGGMKRAMAKDLADLKRVVEGAEAS